MPELPEVETVCRGLQDLLGMHFTQVKVNFPKLRIPVPKTLTKLLLGKKISKITRRSKYILIECAELEEILVIHLGMSGRITIIQQENYQPKKHDHIVWQLDNKSLVVLNDPRRFGLVTLVHKKQLEKHKLFAELGPEPLTAKFNPRYLANKIQNSKREIKGIIMDAKIVVGVGNIYACESLFLSGIHPTSQGESLTDKQIKALVKNIKSTLKKAIKAGGSTLKDYSKANGEMGYFQYQFNVYGREGKACLKKSCKANIARISQQNRSTFYCPSCQG